MAGLKSKVTLAFSRAVEASRACHQRRACYTNFEIISGPKLPDRSMGCSGSGGRGGEPVQELHQREIATLVMLGPLPR